MCDVVTWINVEMCEEYDTIVLFPSHNETMNELLIQTEQIKIIN